MLHLGQGNPDTNTDWEKTSLRAATQKGLGIQVDEKLSMSQQCTLAALKANFIKGCINGGLANRLMEVILPLYSALVGLRLETYIQIWGPQHREGVDQVSPEEGH